MFDPLRDRDPVQVGRYRLRARLGSGGMGEVFLSFDGSDRPVAVKVLRSEFADDRQFRERFAREVRAARQVRGSNVAPLLGADPDAEIPWLATAYVAGPTLAEAVELYGPMPVSSVLVLMAGIAEALRAIHASGIVHRDLKPANVVLGAEGLRVIDFGIARAADATPLTLTGSLVGSPQYVPPEQVLGEPPTPAGDVFSLGVLAHYAATGRPAFGEGARIAVLYRIVNGRPDLIGCPRQIRSLVEACLAREPADRPSLAEILDLCTPDEPPAGTGDWLPEPVVSAIDAYRAALADVVQSGGVVTDPGPDSAPSAERSELAAPDAANGSPGDTRHRIRRGVGGFAAVLAVLVAGVAVTLGIASGSAPHESAAVSGGATSAVSQQPTIAQSGTQTGVQSGQPGAQRGLPGGGPPAIYGLGAPLGPPPAGPPPGGPGPGAGPGPPVPEPTALWWSGTVHITGDGLWLDARPPIGAQGHGDIREAAPAPAAEVSSGVPEIQNLARWTGQGTPTGAQCRELAFAEGTNRLRVGVGDVVCALTAYRQVAVLRIEDIPVDGSGLVAAVTVWGSTPP